MQSVQQGWICSDNFPCRHTDTEVAEQTCHLLQLQYTDTGQISPSSDPVHQASGRAATRAPMLLTAMTRQWSHHQTARAKQPHRLQSTPRSLVPSTGKPGTSSGPRELRCRRSFRVCRNSLKQQFMSSSPPSSSPPKSEVFLPGTVKKKGATPNLPHCRRRPFQQAI